VENSSQSKVIYLRLWKIVVVKFGVNAYTYQPKTRLGNVSEHGLTDGGGERERLCSE